MAECLPRRGRALQRDLSRLLPADGGDTDAAIAHGHHSRHRHSIADRHDRRRDRLARDLAGRAATWWQFSVRAARYVLDRAEEGWDGVAGGGVIRSLSSPGLTGDPVRRDASD